MASAANNATRSKPVFDRIEREYRLYRIVAGDLGGACKAVAYLGMGGARAVEAVEASSVDEAVSQMKDILEARLAAMRQQRRNGLPSAMEFREALAALPSGLRETVRSFQIERLDPTLPSTALTTLALRSQTDIPTALDSLRKAARRLAELLDVAINPVEVQHKIGDLAVLARIEGTDDNGFPILAFHDELREALATLPPERPAVLAGRR